MIRTRQLLTLAIFAFSVTLGLHGASVTITPANPTMVVGQTLQLTANGAVTPTAIATGYWHTCVLYSDQSVRCTGLNSQGELGDNDSTFSRKFSPVLVTGLANPARIRTGAEHTCALIGDGTMQCWGSNYTGQLGDGTMGGFALVPQPVHGITNALDALTGGYFTCAILPDHTVQCWGRNQDGQLGNGQSTTDEPLPAPVMNLGPVAALSAGGYHACALLSDGTAQCWGRNARGQVGDGNQTTPVTVPTPVSGLTNAVQVAGGFYHTCARLADGTVQCWGQNDYGQIGSNSPGLSMVPLTVSGIAGAITVSPGFYHTCAIQSDGGLWCWGRNDFGELGNGTNTSSFTPTQVPGLVNPIAVAAGGFHTCALMPDFSVQCWGENDYGELGNGTGTNSPTPVKMNGTGLTWTSSAPSVATVTAGGLVTAVGGGTATITATDPFGNTGTITLTVGQMFTLTVMKQGDGTGSVTSAPVGITCGTACASDYTINAAVTLTASPDLNSTFAGWTGCDSVSGAVCTVTMSAARSVTAIFTLQRATLTVSKTGNGTVTSSPAGITCGTACASDYAVNTVITLTATPGSDSTITGWTGCDSVSAATCTVTMSAARSVTATFTLQSATLTVGKAGTGTGTVTSSPAGITCGTTCASSYVINTAVTLTAAPDPNSTFSGWTGCDSVSGATCTLTMSSARSVRLTLVLSVASASITPANPTMPVGQTLQLTANGVVTPTGITAGMGHTCVLYSDQSVRCTGQNNQGEVGNGGYANVFDPAVSSGTLNPVSLGAGLEHTCTLVADGRMQCWGSDYTGQLGDGTFGGFSLTPEFVHNMSNAIKSIPGGYFTCAMLPDRTMQCWGRNQDGQLGNGDSTTDTALPGPVLGLGPVADFAAGGYHACALMSDGTARCWGRNTRGQVGDGTSNSPITQPHAVGGLSTVAALSLGGYHSCALLQNGTVQCWGQSDSGQIGAPGLAFSATPVTVSGITNAVGVYTGFLHTCAVLADGTVRCWGNNAFGQLGDGTTTSSATPVQVQGIVNPSALALGNGHTCALMPDSTVRCWGEGDLGEFGTGTNTNSLVPVTMHETGLTWTTSDASVATISASGLVTGVGRGAATITATDPFGNSGTTTLTVGQVPTLTVTPQGTGSGSVSSSPAGISCGATCSAPYASGTTVTLTATPSTGSVFTGWAGCDAASGATCSVTMSAARSVTATFAIPVATPTFSPAGGTYTGSVAVTIGDATSGTTIYYTTNGSTPTTASSVYGGPLTLTQTTTLKAMAAASGMTSSAVASAAYTIQQQVATPTFSPASGTYTGSVTVTMSDATAGATIYYTTDGSTPTTASSVYGGPLTLTQTTTLKAMAAASGMTSSAVASAAYTIQQQVATPTFSPAGGTYTGSVTVTIGDATSGTTIYYTTDGSTPTTASSVYGGPLTLTQTTTLKAMAAASGMTSSAVASAAYTIQQQVATPTFSPASGTYTGSVTVTIGDATSGTTIYYTTDGSTPTTASSVYGGPLTLTQTTTLKAMAAASGMTSSAVASAAYTIQQQVATPTFSPASGTYTGSVAVTIGDATSGTTIYYTTNGSTPTTASSVYGGPLTLTQTTTLKAMAAASGMTSSAVASAAYTIQQQVATPTFSPAGGTYTGSVAVTIGDATSGTTIYYTTDGSSPTTASSVYGGPLTLTQTTTLKAMAAASGMTSSAVASAAYTIQQQVATPTFSPAGGTYTGSVAVTIGDATSGTTIYYTTDGSTPTTSSAVYTGPISITQTTTIKAMAAASGMITSAVAGVSYTLKTATPTFNPPGGTYILNLTVSISDVTPGATIYYTTDGSTPTTSSPVYGGLIVLAPLTTTTIKAIAVAPGQSERTVASVTYTIVL